MGRSDGISVMLRKEGSAQLSDLKVLKLKVTLRLPKIYPCLTAVVIHACICTFDLSDKYPPGRQKPGWRCPLPHGELHHRSQGLCYSEQSAATWAYKTQTDTCIHTEVHVLWALTDIMCIC